MDMTLRLSQYRPFDCTKCLIRETWDTTNWLTVAKSVAIVAIAILPTVIFDIAVSAASLISRCFFPTQQSVVRPPVVAQQARPSERVPNVIQDPYPDSRPPNTNAQFLKDALRTAFSHNRPETVALYKRLIRNDGVLENDEYAPIEIYQWCAGCLLTQYFIARLSRHDVEHLYPKNHPNRNAESFGGALQISARAHERGIEDLFNRLENLGDRAEQSAALLQIMVPSVRRRLSDAAQTLVDRIGVRALAMTQDDAFVHPVAADIDNI